jgi:hypothetical protein
MQPHNETTESHALRVLAQKMRADAAQTDLPWFSIKMIASAVELEAQATSLERLPH